MGKILILVGHSGSGKTTVAESLIQKDDFIKVPTCTTRDMRPGEIDGVHYNYFSITTFLNKVDEGEFVEYSCYANNYYGTRYQELDKALKSNKNIILIMDIYGVKALKEKYPNDCVSIFLKRNRKDLILSILERNVSNEEKANRIIQLNNDDAAEPLCDYVVENVNIMDAINEIESIIK